MKKAIITAAILAISSILTVSSCNRTEQTGPPTIMLGDSTCNQCGMIISDERFATSTILQSERGRKALLFDDFNCQQIFERKSPALNITNRWSRDYLSLDWAETEAGWFVNSSQIRSPMASGMAFFQLHSDAEVLSNSMSGEIMDFETAWSHEE